MWAETWMDSYSMQKGNSLPHCWKRREFPSFQDSHAKNISAPIARDLLSSIGCINSCYLKLASIDASFNILGEDWTCRNTRWNKELHFCDLAGGPGGFMQYIKE